MLFLTHQLTAPPISRSRRSSSASSSSSSSDVTRLTTSQPPRKRSQPGHAPVASTSASAPRLRTRQIVADLARELERVRREADRLLFERDEEVCPLRDASLVDYAHDCPQQITRLEADQSMRRREMAELYSSLDTLLGLAGRVDLGSPQHASLPPDSPALDIVGLSAKRAVLPSLICTACSLHRQLPPRARGKLTYAMAQYLISLPCGRQLRIPRTMARRLPWRKRFGSWNAKCVEVSRSGAVAYT